MTNSSLKIKSPMNNGLSCPLNLKSHGRCIKENTGTRSEKERGTLLAKAFIVHNSLYKLLYSSNKHLMDALAKKEVSLLKI